MPYCAVQLLPRSTAMLRCCHAALVQTYACDFLNARSALGRNDATLRCAAAAALNSMCARMGTTPPTLLLHSGLTPSVLEYVGARAADQPRLLKEVAALVSCACFKLYFLLPRKSAVALLVTQAQTRCAGVRGRTCT